jgi:tetratricopeptide (TPR) repeat protein
MRRWIAVLALLAAAWSPASVLAQSADDDEARALYEAGRHAFESGRYDRALEDFQHAYALSPRPQLLYNIGQAADRLRHDEEALDAFERYLASSEVDETLRAQIEGRVAVLRSAIERHEAAPSETAPPETRPAPAPAPDPTAGVALLVTGGVLAIAGGVMIGLGASENGTLQGAPDASHWSDYAGHLDAANGLAIGGGVALGVGVVGCVVGAILIATLPSSSTTVSIGPGSITLGGTF